MKETRTYRAGLNIGTTLANQLMTTLCGIVIPRIMIGAFGSAVYGATTSIAQFLSYISLLEGGIGRVARAALYRPLAKGDRVEISKVYHGIKRFFRGVGIAFFIYTLVLAVLYHDIARITVFGRGFTFFLVCAISVSTLAKYLGGIGNLTLINADQRQYVANFVVMVTTGINTLLIVLLVHLKCSVLMVKLGSSCVFLARPILFSAYVRKHYALPAVPRDDSALSQKWTGLGQHIAYVLHTNTDVVILTLFADLRLVSVYCVYSLIITSIRNITSSVSGGMEAAFGEMLAKGEQRALQRAYGQYQALLSMAATALFGVTGILIVPFVRLYTAGISDADYIQPAFALLLLLAEAVNCMALPCSTLPISANRLKETRWGAYGEAVINITLSCVLVFWNPLLGVAIGTLVSSVFRSLFYMAYAAKHILRLKFGRLLRNFMPNLAMLGLIALSGMRMSETIPMANFIEWGLWGTAISLLVGTVTVLVSYGLFSRELRPLAASLWNQLRRRLRGWAGSK